LGNRVGFFSKNINNRKEDNMKKLTGAILLAFFACFLIGGTIRAQTPPPGTTVRI